MADALAADCAGIDPLRVQRDAAQTSIPHRNKATRPASQSQSTSTSTSSSRSLRASHDPNCHQDDDAASVASSSGTAGHHRSPSAASRPEARDKGKRKQKQVAASDQQPLRKSASASTTTSARTDTSTEVRAAVSNRASRSALGRASISPTTSPATSFNSWHDVAVAETESHPDQHHYLDPGQGTGISYPAHAIGPESVSDSRPHPEHFPGIIQVNPAPSSTPVPIPHQRGRPQMASSLIPAFFGRRRPTSSASSVTSSNFAAANPPPPGPAAFDFNSILNSLDADTAAQADLDAIAEICGRSRLSLANAHAHHRGPVGEVLADDVERSSAGLETVRESGTPLWDEERRLGGSRAGSAAGEERWRGDGSTDERETARLAGRGAVSGVVAYGTSPRTEEEGRARRHLLRVRDVSNEREQRRQRR